MMGLFKNHQMHTAKKVLSQKISSRWPVAKILCIGVRVTLLFQDALSGND
jgi:hypothetical protein